MTSRRFPLLVLALGLLGSGSTAFAQGPLLSEPAKMNREWVAVCPTEWTGALAPLLAYRVSQGRSACIWTLNDVDDTYGGHSPAHIRQALSDAHANWTTKPRWVLLVGDHDASGGANDIISDWTLPDAELGRWEPYIRGLWPYLDLDDDRVPELAVGRLPAVSDFQVAAYVAKVIAHDDEVNAGGYGSAVTLLQDVDDSGNSGVWARELGDSLHNFFVPDAVKQIVRQSEIACCYPVWEQAAITAWDSGPGMVLVMGTGSNWFQLVDFLYMCGSTNYWTIDELGPSGRFPALLGLSCAINATDHVIASSCDSRGTLTEQLLLARSDRGASVVIAPMRNTIQWWNFLIGKHLLLRKGAGDYTWGEVFQNAMRDALAEDPAAFDHVFQYVLAGDPAAHANRGGVAGIEAPLPERGVWLASSPNPSRDHVTLSYRADGGLPVQLDICDVAGRRVRRLVDRVVTPGTHTESWNLRDDADNRSRAGVFFARLRQGDRSWTRHLVVVP